MNSLLNINQFFDSEKIDNLKNAPNCGLANIGSTCYINSIIQLLGHSQPFVIFLLSKNFDNNNNNILVSKELKEIFDLIWIQHHSLKPNKFLNALQKNFDFINVNFQQDIHEILLLLLNKINEELKINNLVSYKKFNYNQKVLQNLGNKCDKEWYEYHKKEYSEIIDLFYGQIINQIKCNCNQISHSYDFFSILQIEIPKNDTNINLNDCIKSYFSSFFLNDNEKKEWKCDKCNLYDKSKKVAKIWKMPPILLISIKRFEYNNNAFVKNDKDIDIPFELDLDQYIISNNTHTKYKYVGSAIHLGRSNFGHYISIFKKNTEFTVIDDQNINNINEENGINLIKKSYVLLYELS
jgi:ubiquitin carboxyl-terminal hydrolase 8